MVLAEGEEAIARAVIGNGWVGLVIALDALVPQLRRRHIDDLPLQHLNVKLLSVRRHMHQIQQFDTDFCLEGDDILVVAGHKEKIISFENWALLGEG